MNDKQKKQNKQTPKKPYQKPEVKELGKVTDLTQRLGSGFQDRPRD